jgi:NADH-ubiquinone/plastoquinone oxidoreductase chain 6
VVNVRTVLFILLGAAVTCVVGLKFAAGGTLVQHGLIEYSIFISWVFIFACALLACLMVYVYKQNNPLFLLFAVASLVLLAMVFFFNCGVEILALLFLIIYVGAIAILFLFVIMLFNIRKTPEYY